MFSLYINTCLPACFLAYLFAYLHLYRRRTYIIVYLAEFPELAAYSLLGNILS
jgi:hypothetical protein